MEFDAANITLYVISSLNISLYDFMKSTLLHFWHAIVFAVESVRKINLNYIFKGQARPV